MTTTLQAKIRAELGWTWRDHVDASPIVDSNRLVFEQGMANGSGTNQADAVWHAGDQTLSAGASPTFELDALEKELFGDAIFITLLKVKALLITNKNTSGNGHLLVGAAVSDAWHAPFGSADDTVKVMPGGALLLANPQEGWDVTADARDLKITAGGENVTFDVAILGTATGPDGSSSSSSGA